MITVFWLPWAGDATPQLPRRLWARVMSDQPIVRLLQLTEQQDVQWLSPMMGETVHRERGAADNRRGCLASGRRSGRTADQRAVALLTAGAPSSFAVGSS